MADIVITCAGVLGETDQRRCRHLRQKCNLREVDHDSLLYCLSPYARQVLAVVVLVVMVVVGLCVGDMEQHGRCRW
ncbi:hypothetical protein E2C01_009283 [Portunus trituberculatus]|uniref:Uncharacterized protein n=1 Tax=Portunus trituberculatus TaxID=210409 RepID=A0A5B7D462_PORTR|nr:hypothetical protein [Portunus trituberculatus]